ncbi:hypothetical protein H4R34_003472 [Dimargaris verticillata]|uniref:Velvet domain-containing protein n=1 Tax=Dimargaris verticillata TaxID=2761393 RepID=A0A9W8B4H2_9FUNG|nr:hypothetical protein H4R34_003472 [Dimargaris verticillata]
MCGFGEKDRRLIDPPPILRLNMYHEPGQPVTDYRAVDASCFVCLATVWSADGHEERGVVVNPSSIPIQPSFPSANVIALNDPSPTRNLIGSTVVSAQCLNDLNGQPGLFFVFSDLAIRTEGMFSLKFNFVPLGSGPADSWAPIDRNWQVCCLAHSSPFEVFSPRKFPGLTESTELSRCFADQGVKISIRRKGPAKQG